jgi:hypothetical protein
MIVHDNDRFKMPDALNDMPPESGLLGLDQKLSSFIAPVWSITDYC